jgi:hypothetical protein
MNECKYDAGNKTLTYLRKNGYEKSLFLGSKAVSLTDVSEKCAASVFKDK